MASDIDRNLSKYSIHALWHLWSAFGSEEKTSAISNIERAKNAIQPVASACNQVFYMYLSDFTGA